MSGGGVTKLRGSTTINSNTALGIGERTLEVYGELIAEGGFLRFENGDKGTVHIMPGGNLIQKDYFQFTGSGNGYINWVLLNEGTITKEGDVVVTQNRVSIDNRGIINLDYGQLRADFRFIQTADGILNLPIKEAPAVESSFGRVGFGDAFIDGTLNIQLAEGFIPETGASYRIFSGGSNSITGTFSTVNGLNIAEDRRFEIEYENNRYINLNVVEVTQ